MSVAIDNTSDKPLKSRIVRIDYVRTNDHVSTDDNERVVCKICYSSHSNRSKRDTESSDDPDSSDSSKSDTESSDSEDSENSSDSSEEECSSEENVEMAGTVGDGGVAVNFPVDRSGQNSPCRQNLNNNDNYEMESRPVSVLQ